MEPYGVLCVLAGLLWVYALSAAFYSTAADVPGATFTARLRARHRRRVTGWVLFALGGTAWLAAALVGMVTR